MGMTAAPKGVILAAGPGGGETAGWHPGTGMLLPMANMSMIERILDAYGCAGVKETLIAVGRDTREAAAVCGDGARWRMVLTYLQQPEVPAMNEIMREVSAFAGNEVLLATRGSVLLNAEAYLYAVRMYDESGPSGIRLWEGNRAVAGVGRVTDGHVTDGHVNDGCDGNAGSDGIYLLAADACDIMNGSTGAGLRSRNCFSSLLFALAGRGSRVLTMATEHEPYDTGTPETYLDSNERLLASTSRDPDPPEIMTDNFSSPNLVLRPPVVLDDSAELERCRIGPGVCVGPGVRIGHGAVIEHSVIMAGADIGDGASISRAIIGKNASMANRSVTHGRPDRVTVV